MRPVDGVGDPATERFHAVNIEDHDLIFADQLYMVDIGAGKVKLSKRCGFIILIS